MTRVLTAASAAFLLLAFLPGCAQYRQTAEIFANGAVKDIQGADDGYAQAAMLAPTAITLGAFSRLPQDPKKCAVAALSGVAAAGCTLTAADVQAIVSNELASHFATTTTAPVLPPVTARPSRIVTPPFVLETPVPAAATVAVPGPTSVIVPIPKLPLAVVTPRAFVNSAASAFQ